MNDSRPFWRDLLVAVARTGPAFQPLAARQDTFLASVGSALARTPSRTEVAELDAETLRQHAAHAAASGFPATAIALYVLAAERGSPAALREALDLFLALLTPGSTADVAPLLRTLPPGEAVAVTMTNAWGYEVAETAAALRVGEAKVREQEERGLLLLEPPLTSSVSGPGGFDPDFADSTTMPGEVIGGTLTNDEKAMIQLMDPKDRARYLLQKRIQEKAEMAVLLSQLQSLRHQTAMSVINNIR
jgi:hypothetical protein